MPSMSTTITTRHLTLADLKDQCLPPLTLCGGPLAPYDCAQVLLDWDFLKKSAPQVPQTDFEWGMVNGKLSAIRWMLGDEWDMLDT